MNVELGVQKQRKKVERRWLTGKPQSEKDVIIGDIRPPEDGASTGRSEGVKRVFEISVPGKILFDRPPQFRRFISNQGGRKALK
jgi:hypothetical protein